MLRVAREYFKRVSRNVLPKAGIQMIKLKLDPRAFLSYAPS